MKKNQTCQIRITGYTAEGLGVGRLEDGMAVFVPGAARGDFLEILLVKVLRRHAFGKILQVLQPSPWRTSPDCPVFPQCGGCDFRHLTYEEELSLKAQRVMDAMNRIGGFTLPIPKIVPSPKITGYRNKAQFPVGNGETGVIFGFYRSRSHQIVPIRQCLLQSKEACSLAEAVCRWADQAGAAPYDERAHTGLLRHIVIRQGQGGLHLTLVVREDRLPKSQQLIDMCQEAVPALCGIVINTNPQPGNKILGLGCRTLWGTDRLADQLAGNTFHLSPLSFYQVNHEQTQQLYAYVTELAAPQPDTLALDLYCGVGTITLALASRCHQVIGVEIIPQAVADAKENARRNQVHHVNFLCADAGQAAQRLAEDGFSPQVIVVDPPRKGLDQAAVDAICRMNPQRVVYVSCDCASLARDAKLLAQQGDYRLQQIRAFDMFPRTAHVETVCLLTRMQ